MQIEWFVFYKNSILGPYSTEDVRMHVSSGKIPSDSFIWWKGEKDWSSIEDWQKYFPDIIRRLESQMKIQWKIKHGKNITPFLSFDDCLQYLKNLELNNSIYLCKETENNNDVWESIFSNTIFLNALEMNRRKSPRVPILATAKISKLNSKFSYLVKVNTIGQGGMGVTGLGKNFPTGTAIEIKLESPSLSTPVVAEGKILYHTKDGIAGIEYTLINDESIATLIEYVNKFTSPKSIHEPKAA
jgi:hypothetical protein